MFILTDIKDKAASKTTVLSKLPLSKKESILGVKLDLPSNQKLYEMTQQAAIMLLRKIDFVVILKNSGLKRKHK